MAHQKLKKLSDLHYTAIRMKIEGHSGQEIADELNVEKRTVYLWFGDPLVKDELARQRAHIFQVFAEKVSEVGLKAFRVLDRMLDIPLETEHLTPGERLDVLREVLDRIPVTAKSHNGGGPNQQPDPALSDRELLERLGRVVGELGPGVVTDGHYVEESAA